MENIFQYTFIIHAVIGCLLAGIACGLAGTYIVTRRIVFISGGIAHASLGGIGIFAMIGLPPLWGATTAALLTSWSAEALSSRKEVRQDSAIALLWTLGMSIGILCSYLTPTFLPSLPSYLFGNILLISSMDLVMLGILAVLCIVGYVFYGQQLACISFDREFAQSRKLPVRMVEYVSITLTALVTVACLRVTGVVMVIALLSVPQMTAGLLTHHYKEMAVISTIIATVCCLVGLVLSYMLDIPSGATIILTCIAFYGLLRTIKRFKHS